MDKVIVEIKQNILQIKPSGLLYLDKEEKLEIEKLLKKGTKNTHYKDVYEFELEEDKKDAFLKKHKSIFTAIKQNYCKNIIQVLAPYSELAIKNFKLISGKWNETFKCWEFPNKEDLKNTLLEKLKAIYGYCHNSPTGEVRIAAKKDLEFWDRYFLGGYLLVTKNFSKVDLGGNVALLKGNVKLDRKIVIENGSVFSITNFPLEAIPAGNKDKDFHYEIVEKNLQDNKNLAR